MNDKLNNMNNDIKTYLNESKFVSNRCRNKIIKMLIDKFNIDIDSSKYKEFANVDITLESNGDIILRGDRYKTLDNLTFEDVESRFSEFREDAHNFMSHKDIDFNSKNNFNNIVNLIMIILIICAFIGITLIAIYSVFTGNYFFGIWFVVMIVPWLVPNLKENLLIRLEQANNFIKRIIKK